MPASLAAVVLAALAGGCGGERTTPTTQESSDLNEASEMLDSAAQNLDSAAQNLARRDQNIPADHQ